MDSDTTPYSISAVWSRLYNELKNTPWEAEDLDVYRFWHNEPSEHAPVVDALKEVHDRAQGWKGVDPEDGVLATLKAAYKHYASAFLTPAQVKGMAENFSAFYADPEEPLVEYLLEHYNGIPLRWLTDQARWAITTDLQRESEIWIKDEPNLSGVWVFNKPVQTPHDTYSFNQGELGGNSY